MIAWDSGHYLATLSSIEVAEPIVAESAVAEELRAMLLCSFLQCSSIDIVEAILEIDLDWGRHLEIIAISKSLKVITSQDDGVELML